MSRLASPVPESGSTALSAKVRLKLSVARSGYRLRMPSSELRIGLVT